jgi:ferrous iron transport protein B
MATRTLESKTDRILTILITPFMSCSAKLPVYIVLAGAFFGTRAGSVIFAIYLTGIVLSIATGRLFRSTLFRGADAPFVMELPPYRVPMFKSLMIHMWDRSKIFIRRMGGVILIGSIIVWALANFPRDPRAEKTFEAQRLALQTQETGQTTENLQARQKALEELKRRHQAARADYSLLGRLGRALQPLFTPIGVDWRGGVALLSGFVAKEIVVSTLGVLHAVSDLQEPRALEKALKSAGMTRLSALAMMLFVLLYLPCLATVTAIRRETGAVKWMVLSIAYSTTVAWLAAFVVYQGGQVIGFG